MASFGLRLLNLKCRTNVRFVSDVHKVGRKGVTPIHIKKLENLMINRVLNNNENTDIEKWKKIRDDLFASGLPLTTYNIDATIIERCQVDNKFEAAVNYIEYLMSTNQKINLGTINKFFSATKNIERPLNEKEMNLIIKLYENIRAEFPILDPRTATSSIHALCLTKRWKEYKELLHMAGMNIGYVATYESIAAAAFNHDDWDEGWEIIKSITADAHLGSTFCDSYLNYCMRHSKNLKEVESHLNTLFEFFAEHNIHPTLESMTKYGNYLEKVGGWVSNKTRLDSSGTCLVCGNRLEPIQITPDEFELLKQSFFSKVVVGNDVYCNTTPEEIKYFQKFIEKTKPYDVVIDGLNVAYLSATNNKMNRARDLMQIVQAFVKKNKKIFVLGRKHMNSWRAQEMEYVRQHAHLYLANDLSKDDAFLLHAALSSGIQTYFCSRDLMRQHIFALANNNVQRIFRSWQMSRQIYPTAVGGIHNKQYLLVDPPKIKTVAQMNHGSWHIPYRQNDPDARLTSPLWLCLKKPKI